MGTSSGPKNAQMPKIPGRLIGGTGRKGCGWSIIGQTRRCAVTRAADDRRPAKPEARSVARSVNRHRFGRTSI